MLRDDVDKYFTYKNYNNDKNNDEYDMIIMMIKIMMIKIMMMIIIMIMMMIILKNVNLKIAIEKPHIVN